MTSSSLRPHDLLWLTDRSALQGVTESWWIRSGMRGCPWWCGVMLMSRGASRWGCAVCRDQRAPGWVDAQQVVRIVTPEQLTDAQALVSSPFISAPPVQVAFQLAQHTWPWVWGITGSVGYALATGIPVIHAASDLDLLIRAPQPLSRDALVAWQQRLDTALCRADTQVETPSGGFALNEWLRDGQALLKTRQGPRLVSDPWRRED